MATEVAEKKVWYLGSWKNDVIADNVIRQISTLSREKKGTKVKVQLAGDGLRVLRSNLIQGKTLTDFIPIQNLYYMTVNQHYPECLLVIAKDRNQKYQILAFRCTNGLDAGYLIQSLQTIRRRFRPGEGYNFEFTQKEGGNWTLRSKPAMHDKRQLKTIVDMKADGNVRTNGVVQVEKTQDVRTSTVTRPSVDVNSNKTNVEIHVAKSQHSPPVVKEKVFREEVYLDGITQHNIGIQAIGRSGEGVPDNVSEASDSNQSFQSELNYLSNELREIKFMLEKSTGISAEEYHDKSGKSLEKQNVEKEVNDALQPIDAVVLTDEESDSPVTNGHFFRQKSENDGDGEIRVSVPDYRSFGVQTAPKYAPKRSSTIQTSPRQSTSDQPELLRAVPGTTSYQTWKDEVVLRSKPGRVQRPRSAVYQSNSFRSSTSGSIRGSWKGVPNDGQVHLVTVYDDTKPVAVHQRNRFSTSVQRPIEKVYVRPYGSISTKRPRSVHVIHTQPVFTTVPHTVDFNQNKINGHVVKGEVQANGHVSGPNSPRDFILHT
ncbi:hypothetical protein FSP39_014821 [Pinctada imbricata]|uniref:Uncharacterized protein n=1 Tax=Pinctada imbricata TaxID=66713 RepID=A0AA89BJE9_PINIB|nr:hypothetical protein FSP39_014821 [Pinctada imbricata]